MNFLISHTKAITPATTRVVTSAYIGPSPGRLPIASMATTSAMRAPTTRTMKGRARTNRIAVHTVKVFALNIIARRIRNNRIHMEYFPG